MARKKASPKSIEAAKKTRGPSAKKSAQAPAYRPFEKLAVTKRARAGSEEEPRPRAPGKHEPRVAGDDAAEPPAPEPSSFEEHMRDVRPLSGKATRIPRTTHRLEPKTPSRGADDDLDAPARARLHALVTDAIRFEVTDDGTSVDGRRLDVDPRELRRLRTLGYPIDGKLDLHGMRASEAKIAVARFLAKRAVEGDRAVLVVHGKGRHSPRGDAVLRGELGAWLSQGAAARHVLAFASVVDRLGESGSVLVLLSR